MSLVNRMSRFWDECIRVLRVTKKPSKDEYKVISQVAAIGILVIGGIGFALRMIEEVFSLAIAAVIVLVLVLVLLYFVKV